MTVNEMNLVLTEADLLVDEAGVTAAIGRLAEEITAELAQANPLLLCVMNGGLIFAGQLATRLVFPLEMDYCHATRYGNETTGAGLDWIVRPRLELEGRTVLLVDDILDEGVTLAAIADHCRKQGAARVLMAVLVDKRHDRKVSPGFRADFTGMETTDRFLFGYGLDYKGYWRNAPGIYATACPQTHPKKCVGPFTSKRRNLMPNNAIMEHGSDLVINENTNEMSYYSLVRSTLHGLDGVRLNTSIYGLIVSSGFLGIGFSAWQYAPGKFKILFYEYQLHSLLTFFSCLLALIVSIQFIFKISMFSYFIDNCVSISKDFEHKLVIFDKHKLTIQFEHHPYAGPRGDKLFKVSLVLLAITAFIGLVYSAINF